MHLLKVCATASVAFAAVLQLNAQVLWSDNFSSYNTGSLDSNDGSGPNQAPNGGPGNPWWGPGAPNAYVLASTASGITPYPGDTHLISANTAGPYYGEDEVNLAHRFNGGNNFLGNISLSWAFYDPAGSGKNASGFQDFVILGGYQSADGYTSTKDYTGSGEDLQSSYTAGDDLLCLGAYSGGNTSFYQVRVLNSSTPTQGASLISGGWYNTTAARTVGWHTASIVLGAPNGANTPVSMYIDGTDVLDEVLGPSSMDALNSLIVDGAWGSQYGAYDNFVLSQVPEPGPGVLLVLGGLSVLALRRRK
jgi:hypothetical protein